MKGGSKITEENWDSIFWDFDGVLMNSNEVRDKGFSEVLKDYPAEQVQELLDFHKRNGGLSRYVKFGYFFNEIRKEAITEEQIDSLADKFSKIMLNNLINHKLLITETLEFVKNNTHIPMHIVSGSDQKELRFITEQLELDKFFISINGSPTPKIQLVKNLIETYNYNPTRCILVGDSINDYEAAKENHMFFMAYNNPSIDKYSTGTIKLI